MALQASASWQELLVPWGIQLRTNLSCLMTPPDSQDLSTLGLGYGLAGVG